jgi:hypothetical protein
LLHVPALHVPPWQQTWPDPPHCAQRLFRPSHANGAPQKSPPRAPGQHRWASPPQGTHAFPPEHIEYGAVHCTSWAQHSSPSCPHAPAMQPPLVHVP